MPKVKSAATSSAWPRVFAEPRIWVPASRPTARADREFRAYEAACVPEIAKASPCLDAQTVARVSAATAAIAALDTASEGQALALWSQMLRSESVASSKIENIYTRQADLAAALLGARASKAAREVAAHVQAIEHLVRDAERGEIAVNSILGAHRALLANDPIEGAYAGRFRAVQNWIGGSDETPRGAEYVPPPPERVQGLMADLVRFMARDDLAPLVQAAIAHAQFETIHPFTDGNGRVGRALVHAILRRRGLTSVTLVPIAAALLADPKAYFEALTHLRDEGDVNRFVDFFAACAAVAAVESRITVRELLDLLPRWRREAKPRNGSMMDQILETLVQRPVLSAEDVCTLTTATPRAAYDVLEKLESLGILKEMTRRKRDRLWSATDVFDAIDSLEQRIGRRRTVKRG
jgi:Fic family protein